MPAQQSARHWPFLDLVRALAATLVMLGHARGFFFLEFAALPAPGTVTKFFYFLTGLQHEGVVLFFLVSGFLVGGAAWAAFDAGRFDAWQYLTNRFARIYLVLLPGLVLAAAIYIGGMAWFGDTRSFSQLPPEHVSPAMLLCHLSCLQGIFCSVLVVDAPLWSLAYEWLLYLAAPLVLALCYAPRSVGIRGAALAPFAATAVTVLPVHMQWSWIGVWAIGALAWRMSVARPVAGSAAIVGLVLTAAALVASRLQSFSPPLSDFCIAVPFAIALASPAVLAYKPWPRVVRALADCSYSLYVIHLPVILLTVAVLERIAPLPTSPPDGRNVILFAATAGCALAAASLFAWFTERHTARLQKALRSGAPKRPRPDF